MPTPHEHVPHEPVPLERVRARRRIPALVAGTLDATRFDAEVVGTTTRGGTAPATLDDLWHIGSCTKSLTAALYGLLVQRGEAEWAAPVASLFGDLAGEIDPAWSHRTVDELLHCRAGVAANLPIRDLATWTADTRPLPQQRTDAALVALRPPPVRPGRFVYSNLSYLVVGAAIDRLTGTSWEQALADLLLTPLGVSSLGYGAPPRVLGHRGRLVLGPLAVLPGPPTDPAGGAGDNPPVMSAAGTAHLTVGDWARLLRAFLVDADGPLAPATVDHLLAAPPGAQHAPGAMVMGWARADRAPGASYGMQGSNTFWAATALLSDDRRRAALVLANDGRTSVLTASARLALDLLRR